MSTSEDARRDTEQAAIEAELRRERDEQAAFLASLQDGFEVLDRLGTIIDVNDRFAEIVGLPREQIIGLRPPFPWWLEDGPERADVETAMTSVLDGGSGEFDLTFQRSDGQLVHVILNANTVPDRVGGRVGIVAIVKDVSERVAAQIEREELLGNLSVERARLRSALERLARMQRFTASIAFQSTEGEIVASLITAARDGVKASGAAVVLLTEDGELEIVIEEGDPDPTMVPKRSPPDADGDLAEVFRSARSRWLEPRPGPTGPDERWGFVPIVRRGGSMGVLAICCPEETFTVEDRDTLETMVWQAAQALERARLREAEAQTQVTLTRVLTVSDAALEWMESDEALPALLRRIREAVGADSASLLVREGDHLLVRATDGLERDPQQQVPVPLGEGFAGRIAATAEPYVAEELSKIDVVSPWMREQLRSVAGVPILRGNEVIGVLHVGSATPRRFEPNDVELLDLVAARVGSALERAQLFGSVRSARTDAARTAERLRRLQTATAALTGAMSVEDASNAILREAMAAVGADGAVLAVPSNGARSLDVIGTKGRLPKDAAAGQRFGVDESASICEAHRTGEIVWVPTRREWERRFPDGLASANPWARSILAVPLRINERGLGSIGLLFATERKLRRDERRLAKTFADQAAIALERARLFEDERSARDLTERVQAFASSLAAVASSDDVLSILVDEGRRLIGARSAWAALLDPGTQELHATAFSGFGPKTIDPLARFPLNTAMPACDAARERREIWFDSSAEFDRAYPGIEPPQPKQGEAFGCLPMLDSARGVMGVVSFQLPGGAQLDGAQRSTIRAVVTLAAQSLERSQLYERDHAVARVLQKSLLPGSLPGDRRVELATRYLPGTEDLDVGGDWFDVIHVAPDRIGVTVGDVVGHGLEAASAMGQLRSALRAIALNGHGPAAIINGLDRFARTTAPATLATVVYAELDLEAGELRYACAGHPPPLIVVGGDVTFLEGGRTTPLAALPDPTPCQEGWHPFPPGSLLVLYSDGLIERRGEPLDVGMGRLETLLREGSAQRSEELADRLLDTLTGEVPQDDDVALLCLRAVSLEDAFSTSMPPRPEELAGLRERVRTWLTSRDVPPEIIDDLVLATDEACANSIEHAFRDRPGAPIRIDIAVTHSQVVIDVADSGTWHTGDVGRSRGRGVAIMRGLMDDVNLRPTSDGTLVTLRRRLPTNGPAIAMRTEDPRGGRSVR